MIVVVVARVGVYRVSVDKHTAARLQANLATAKPLTVNPSSLIGAWHQVGKLCQDESGSWIGTPQQCRSGSEDIEVTLTISGDDRSDAVPTQIQLHGNPAAMAAEDMLHPKIASTSGQPGFDALGHHAKEESIKAN